MKTKKILTTGLVLTGALLVMPLFNIYAQPSGATKSALQEIVDLKEGLKETLESRKGALQKILDLSVSETGDLQKQLNNLKNLDADYLKVRDGFLAELNDFLDYFAAFDDQLSDKNLSAESVKKLAAEFKEWRANQYNPTIKKVLNFLLVFQEKATLKTATQRLEKIAGDLGKLKFSKIIKTELLQPLLDDAAEYLQTAQYLNEEAQRLLLAEKPDQEAIRQLVEESFQNIKAAYKSFVKMGALLKEMLGR